MYKGVPFVPNSYVQKPKIIEKVIEKKYFVPEKFKSMQLQKWWCQKCSTFNNKDQNTCKKCTNKLITKNTLKKSAVPEQNDNPDFSWRIIKRGGQRNQEIPNDDEMPLPNNPYAQGGGNFQYQN